MVPSQLHVATLLCSSGCHSHPMVTWSWALKLRNTRCVFQSQKNSFPSASPEMTKRPSGEKLIWHAYPPLVCPVNTFFCESLNRSLVLYTRIWLSSDCAANQFWLGCMVMAGMECMEGSAMYFMTTGMPNSHTRMDLSSEVVMNRRFSSQKVIVFTAPRCWSYVCVISPASMSHWTIFLSVNPASRQFCLSSSGLKRTTHGVLPVVNVCSTWPVSVSHSLRLLSYEQLTNFRPSLLNVTSLTALECPRYVRMHLPLLCTSQILILESMEPDSNRWPVPGKNWIFDTPLVCPAQVCTHFLGM
mmetsp:Transcript_4241/g.7211  ORF Transcript_4241/g.7211 Transcript_4241/m.7211 type:complete len:301 (-) Transcript_4241:1169-2071(-)